MAGGRESTFSEFHDGATSASSSKLGSTELLVLEDLNKSGLSPKDIQARISNAAELTACGLRITHVSNSETGSDPIGYTIPYYDHQGKLVPYYRIKVLRNGGDAKYRQPVGSPNRIYFPRDFLKVFLAQVDDDTDTAPIILLTEGEKKAAKAVKCGFPAVAVSGVDSWRNRTLIVPRESKISLQYSAHGDKGRLGIQIPSSDTQIEEFDLIAIGLSDVISLALQFSATIMIVFDEDVDGVPNPHVDRAAASLGYALREKGIAAAQLRLLRLKSDKITEGKLGLDDYLVVHSPANLTKLIHDCLDDPHALPTHPDPASFVARTLNTGTVTRKDAQRVALAILTELDARGIRMWSPTHRLPHFFDNGSKRLFPIELMRHSGAPLHETPFGRYLYSKFRLSGGDHKPLNWLASQITGEGDLPEVNPLRVLTTVKVPEISPLPCIAVQVSDSYYILVSGNPNPLKGIQVCHNGQHGLMFVQDEVLPLDAKKVVQEALIQAQEPFKPYWPEVLKEVNFANKDGSGPFIASPLYYISPWFLRWSGMQLPIEVYTGEAGSGKAQALHSKVLTPDGWKLMGDLKLNDEVLMPNGRATKIIAIHPQGPKQLYKVTLNDGSSTLCCADHLWNIKNQNAQDHESRFDRGLHPVRARPLTVNEANNRHKWAFTRDKIVSLKDLMEKPLVKGSMNKPEAILPLVKADIEWRNQSALPIPAYLLGLLLGDGCFRRAYTIAFTTIDPELKEAAEKAAVEAKLAIELVQNSKRGKIYDFRFNSTAVFRQHLKELELWGKLSLDKHIPEVYLQASAEDRLALLQGLMDTDGTVGGMSNSATLNTSSKQLMQDVRQLVWSLGGTAYMNVRTAPERTGTGQRAYNIHIRLPLEMEPFRLKRKLEIWKSIRHQPPKRYIVSVEPYGVEEAQCITIEDPSGLYITDDYIVTHNSSLVSLRLLIMTGRAPLRNSPNDVRDWHSSIANVGGLHVVDNMHMTDKALRQRLSDEMARIVTEPHPHIEMRQLYTSSDILRLPISATFALTAIHTPFTNTDFQQRSIHFELERPLGPQVRPPDSEWVPKQLEKFGGRLKWLAHQIAFIHLFLKKVQNTSRWEELIQGAPMQNNYGSRLIYYGAAMQLAAEILGSPVLDVSKPLASKGSGANSSSSSSSLAKEIQSHGEAMILETDHWMRALKQYVDMKRKKARAESKSTAIFTASQFFEWLCTLSNSEIGHAPEDLAQTQRFLKRNRGLIARVLDLHEHTSSTSNDIAFQLTL